MAWFERDGVRIRYEETGTGDPVLLLPGFAGRIEEFQSVVDGLSPEFRVVAADLPGSGDPQPIPREYTPDYYEDDAKTFVAFVRELIGRPAHLVGFSDGGEVALLMAIQDPSIAMRVAAWGLDRLPPTGGSRHGRRDGRDRRSSDPRDGAFSRVFRWSLW
jgi:valacyclovir hydrolase